MFNEICPASSRQHVVRKGDTLWKLSRFYGVSVQSILDLNPGINPENLQIGSTLCIPIAQKEPAPMTTTAPITKTDPLISATPSVNCQKGAFRYTVQEGDTLWKLSRFYGVGVQSILDLNPGINPENLQIGSTLCIPIAQKEPAPMTTTAPITKTDPLISSTPSVNCQKGAFRYTVQGGDTLWKLSQFYGVSVQSILDLNPGINPENLQIGSTLCIPIAQKEPAPMTTTDPITKTDPLISATPSVNCQKGAFRYTVQGGDTLWKLSRFYGVSVQSILDLNPGINPENLQIGSTLCIPIAQKEPAPMTTTAPITKTDPLISATPSVNCQKGAFRYTVQGGDTLWKLSQFYGVSVQSILDLNPGINPENLQIGSTLCIPIAQKEPAPMTTTAPLTTATFPRNFAYLIKKCDTICTIARKFYVSVASILRENPGINPRYLQVGTYIYVPINCCGENTWRYTVRECDTLNRIANKLNVCPSAIIAANPNIDFQHLIHCQVICIPNE